MNFVMIPRSLVDAHLRARGLVHRGIPLIRAMLYGRDVRDVRIRRALIRPRQRATSFFEPRRNLFAEPFARKPQEPPSILPVPRRSSGFLPMPHEREGIFPMPGRSRHRLF